MIKRGNALKGGGLRGLVLFGCFVALAPLWARSGPRSEIQVERILIPAPTIYEVQRGLNPRQCVLVQKGQPGLRIVTWVVYRAKGQKARQLLQNRLVRPPQPTLYRVGLIGSLTSRGGFRTQNSFLSRRVLTMEATAYDPGPRSCRRYADGRTALGWRAGYGLVAVDPQVIPLGTLLYVEGYGMAIAADRGRAIRGNKIDLCYATRQQAIQFGRRKVRVHVLRPMR